MPDKFAMKPNRKQMISSFVKEARLAKGYTQKELSELSNISVRSIQRIENGEILPRSYTLRTLGGILGISFENVPGSEPVAERSFKMNGAQKIIFSAGLCIFILLLSWAFLAQSPRFPETTFEFLVFSAVVLLILTILLVFIWRTKRRP